MMKQGEMRLKLYKLGKQENRSISYKNTKQMLRRIGGDPKSYTEMKRLENVIHRSKDTYIKESQKLSAWDITTLTPINRHKIIIQQMRGRKEALIIDSYINPVYAVYRKYCQDTVDVGLQAIANKIESSKYTGVPQIGYIKHNPRYRKLLTEGLQ